MVIFVKMETGLKLVWIELKVDVDEQQKWWW